MGKIVNMLSRNNMMVLFGHIRIPVRGVCPEAVPTVMYFDVPPVPAPQAGCEPAVID